MVKILRNFIIHNEDGTEKGVFTGNHPRQAALKVANRFGGSIVEPVIIKLRERGTKKVHVYQAWRQLVNAPVNKPEWLPVQIYKPFVKKIGLEKLVD